MPGTVVLVQAWGQLSQHHHPGSGATILAPAWLSTGQPNPSVGSACAAGRALAAWLEKELVLVSGLAHQAAASECEPNAASSAAEAAPTPCPPLAKYLAEKPTSPSSTLLLARASEALENFPSFPTAGDAQLSVVRGHK